MAFDILFDLFRAGLRRNAGFEEVTGGTQFLFLRVSGDMCKEMRFIDCVYKVPGDGYAVADRCDVVKYTSRQKNDIAGSQDELIE